MNFPEIGNTHVISEQYPNNQAPASTKTNSLSLAYIKLNGLWWGFEEVSPIATMLLYGILELA